MQSHISGKTGGSPVLMFAEITGCQCRTAALIALAQLTLVEIQNQCHEPRLASACVTVFFVRRTSHVRPRQKLRSMYLRELKPGKERLPFKLGRRQDLITPYEYLSYPRIIGILRRHLINRYFGERTPFT